MSDQSTKSRFSIDIDELERQLRQTASAGSAKTGAQADPLAELARIVGKDDPFKVMFEQPKARPAAPATPAPAPAPAPMPAAPVVQPPMPGERMAAPEPYAPLPDDSLRGALSEFDSLLREEFGPRPEAGAPAVKADGIPRAEADMLASHIDEIVREQRDTRLPETYETMPGAEPEVAPQPDLVPLAPRRNRKGALMIGGLLSIAVIGIGGAIAFRPGPKAPSGEPPTIKASAEPTKVQPQNPGGAEVPNQNRTILERQPEAKPADTRVVNREEQPMDVQAAARQAARVILPTGPSAPAATPAPTPSPAPAPAPAPVASAPASPATPAPVAPPPAATPAPAQPVATAPASPLGEPRRVRTIAIRPDGSVIGAPPATPAASPNPVPSFANAAPPAIPAPAATPAPAARPATPVAPAAPARPEQTATPAQPARQPDRVATAPAQPVAAAPKPAAPKPATPKPAAPDEGTGTTGGFAVQLGAPGSDGEARTAFASLQRRFPEQLGGRSPLIRKADLPDGRTVYRLRVGPLSREAATSMCESLKASGGSCFIARN